MSGNEMSNTKAAAWDNIGSLFWEQGRKSAKPSTYELDRFSQGIKPGDRVCVVGASTKDLVCLLMGLGAKVTVYDFSSGMCHSLREAISDDSVKIERLDIVAPLDACRIGSQDYVLNDRLVNRFTGIEAKKALSNMCALASSGEIRASIKLGYYPMDHKMIALGKDRGTLDDFFDAETRTIDFSNAGTVLNDALLAHGDIDFNLLLDWYRGRAAEKRFEHEDIVELINEVTTPDGRAVAISAVDDFPDAISTNLYSFSVIP